MSGSRARGRPKMNWMNNVMSWTGLTTTEGAIRAVDPFLQCSDIVCWATGRASGL